MRFWWTLEARQAWLSSLDYDKIAVIMEKTVENETYDC